MGIDDTNVDRARTAPGGRRPTCVRRALHVGTVTLAVLAGTVLAPSTAGASGASVGAPQAPRPACATASGVDYTVSGGESWFTISQRLETAMRSLLAANGATDTTALHPGDVLCLPPDANTANLPPCSTSGGTAYTVATGDGWSILAGRAGISMSALLGANSADATRVLHPGDVICFPAGTAAPTSASSSAPGSSGSPGVTPARRGDGASCASDAAGTYTVRSGDSWFGIAQRAGVSAGAVFKANGATDSAALHPGNVLCLPAGATVPTGTGSGGNVTLQALPMQGPCGYSDGWHNPRGGGRRHVGTDLFSRTGAYIYAVVDGTLTGRAWDQPWLRAGNAWSLTSADGSGTRFFYAHLADFAPGLQVGSTVKAGEIIGFMGATGNAAAPHLHFEIRPNGGGPVNPYPILRAAGGCRTGTPYRQPSGWTPDG